MSMQMEQFGPKVKLPNPHTVFGEMENRMRQKAAGERDRIVGSVRAEIPRRTGRTAAATTGRVTTSSRGMAIQVSNHVNAHHLRFLQTGTGRYGPRRRKIPVDRRGFIKQSGALGRPSGKGFRSRQTLRKIMKAAWHDVGVTSREMRRLWEELSDGIAKEFVRK